MVWQADTASHLGKESKNVNTSPNAGPSKFGFTSTHSDDDLRFATEGCALEPSTAMLRCILSPSAQPLLARSMRCTGHPLLADVNDQTPKR